MCKLLRIFICALLYVGLVNPALEAQGNVFNIWHFGQWAGLDFNGGAPVAIYSGQTITNEGTASISNAAGALLFYTDGVLVWDRTHTQMTNGFGMSGDVSTTQSALIVQRPGSANLYYVFTVPADGGLTDLRYSVVDMTLNGGFGDIPAGSKNILMAAGSTVAEKITAVRHCNGVDWWIITHGLGNNSYRSWLLSAAGVAGAPVVSNAGTLITTAMNRGLGWLTASHNGQRLVLPSYSGGTLDIVDFNNATAAVSNPRILTGLNRPYGTEFSANDGALYLTADMQLFQYNPTLATAALITASRVTLATEGNMMRAIRMAPDGKIYVCREWDTFLGVINNPNTLGAGCGYNPFGIDLSPSFNSLGLPNNYHFFNPCGPMDVEGFAMQAMPEEGAVRLVWENKLGQADQVSFERSTDGAEWETIGEVQGRGDVTVGEWRDELPVRGEVYYRILARDLNGEYIYSNVARAWMGSERLSMHIQPNPSSACAMQFWMNAAGEATLTVMDVSGRTVHARDLSVVAGFNAVGLSLPELPAGIYILEVRSGNSEMVGKWMKE